MFEPAYAISVQNLNKLAKNNYGSDINLFDVIREYEWFGQSSYCSYDVDGDTELGSIEDPAIVQHWIDTGEHAYITVKDLDNLNIEPEHVLHRLYKDGHIPAGKWIVTIDW